jgi:hypothetical protein
MEECETGEMEEGDEENEEGEEGEVDYADEESNQNETDDSFSREMWEYVHLSKSDEEKEKLE